MVRQPSRSISTKKDRRGPRGTSAKQSGVTGTGSRGTSRSRPKRDAGSRATHRWSTGSRIASLTAGRFQNGPASASVGTAVAGGLAQRSR